MDRYRYFIFNQRIVVVLGLLQMGCAGLCVVCGLMDAAFRKDSELSRSRAPLWAGAIMAIPGILALFSSQKKNPILVTAMISASLFSCVTTVIVVVYASLTLSYGEDDDELLHPSRFPVPHAAFILGRMVKGANVAILLACCGSLLLSALLALVGCRSLPRCACYDSVRGLESLVPQEEPSPQTELICTWQAGSDDRLFNSPVQMNGLGAEQEEVESSKVPPYIRLT